MVGMAKRRKKIKWGQSNQLNPTQTLGAEVQET